MSRSPRAGSTFRQDSIYIGPRDDAPIAKTENVVHTLEHLQERVGTIWNRRTSCSPCCQNRCGDNTSQGRLSFRHNARCRFVHIAEIHTQNVYNVQESLNWDIKPLLRRRGGFKIINSPLIGLAILGYNFFRPHAALGGKTPAEAAGICVEGDDRILTLLEAAAA